MKKDRNYLINMYNATSTDDGKGELETYEAWLERQLLSRIDCLESAVNEIDGVRTDLINSNHAIDEWTPEMKTLKSISEKIKP